MIVNSKKDVNFRQIGQNMKEFRRKKKYLQEEVIRKTGMESYGNYERGSQAVCLWRLIQFCELYDASPNDLLKGCTPALSARWETNISSDEEYSRALEALRCECHGLTAAQLNLLAAVAREMRAKK